jgi:hypothetical protein
MPYAHSEKHSGNKAWLLNKLAQIGLLSSCNPCVDQIKISGI